MDGKSTSRRSSLGSLLSLHTNYEEAAKHAAEALKCQDAQLEDYNNLGFKPADVSWNGEMQTVNYSALYRYGDNQVANYKENYLSQYFKNQQLLIPSESLIELYDQDNDLRYKQFFNKYALWEQGVGGLGDDIVYNKFNERIQAGPTMPEMLLTEAEALARTGKWQEAMNYVNQLRQARFDKNAEDITLEADNQQDAIEKSWRNVTARCLSSCAGLTSVAWHTMRPTMTT